MFERNIDRQIENNLSKSNDIYFLEKTSTEALLNPLDNLALQRLNNFPTTRYYGSKRKILQWLYESVKDIPFLTVLDAFGGTSTVSLMFKAMGKEVTFNDALLSNTVVARALLANHNSVKKNRFESVLESIVGFEGFISKNFDNVFYTDDENKWLDEAITKIQKFDDTKRNVYFYCIFQACLQKRPFNLFHRANLNLRLKTNQQRSFGNLVTWNTTFATLAKKAFNELDLTIWNSEKTHTVLEAGDVCRLNNGYDLVYLDPPYLNDSSKSDNYLNKYHFLEGMVRYDTWSEHIDYNSKCLSFKDNDDIKKWHDKKVFQELLFELIEFHKKSIVVLSYINNSYPSVDSILQFFKKNLKIREYKLKQYQKPYQKIKEKKS